MMSDNYDPNADPLEIRTDIKNLVDGLYVVYSIIGTVSCSPKLLELKNKIWYTLKDSRILMGRDIKGVIGPIPRMMK